ncbi:glycosyltransferase [Geodermatophilus pulveris]|uniref:glycosyltransferase n=1 Tax=Geodermatophilus pulveris TaxID=1564159 RepID=UPI001C52C9E4|nr:glycosyltransferase [Geodermatophilus pulveris]
MVVVHERFTEYAGSEAVVEQLARHWPDAPLLAPVHRPGTLPPDLERRVRSTALSRLLRGSRYAHLLPLLPSAMRRLPIPDCDVVVASHHAFATQVVHATTRPVVAYVHSPARWVWDASMREGEAGPRGQAALAVFSAAFRPADRQAAARVHTLVANSRAVAERVRSWWGREATVVHPPVDTDFYTPDADVAREDFFLLAGRLVPYKRPDLAVQAANRAGVPLVVVGDGRVRTEVERLAGPTVRVVGRVDDAGLRDLYRRCRALVMPGLEDFGIVPVEAQACGAPVLALDAGGARDSVVPGLTGDLVPVVDADREVAVWAECLSRFEASAYDPAAVRRHAEGFSRARFRSAMDGVVRAAAGGADAG